MDEKDLQRLEKLIKTTVNGKIDRLQKSFDDHMKEVKPILDAYNGANTFGRFMIWSGKVIVSISLVVGAIVTSLRFLK